MAEVDPAFIQDLEHRPKLSPIEAEGMPLIDLSPLTNAPDAIESLVSEIRDACKKQGFFQVISHEVPLEQRQKTEDTSRRFFTQPSEEKRKVRRDKVRVLGYHDSEHTKNVKDWKDVFNFIRFNHHPPALFLTLLLVLANTKMLAPFLFLLRMISKGLEVRRKSDGEWIQIKHRLISSTWVTSFRCGGALGGADQQAESCLPDTGHTIGGSNLSPESAATSGS